MNRIRRRVLAASALAAVFATAGCTGSSDSTGTAGNPAPIATQTVTSAAPPAGSGVPASTPAAGGGTGTTGAGASSGPGLCTPTVMTFAVSPPDGAAGTSYFTVTATNGSATSCVTTGFPGVAFLDGSGNQFLQAERDTTVAKTTLTVAPGASVHATIAAGDVGSGGGTCTASPAILFTLPDNTDSTKLTIDDASVCDGRVQALVSGKG